MWPYFLGSLIFLAWESSILISCDSVTRVLLFPVLFFLGENSCSLWFAKSVSFPLHIVFHNFPCQHCIGWSVLVWNLASSRRARCKCPLAAHQAPSCVLARSDAFCSWNKICATFLLSLVPCAADWMQLWSNLDSFSETVMLDFVKNLPLGEGVLGVSPIVSAHELSAFWETHALEVKLLERIRKEKCSTDPIGIREEQNILVFFFLSGQSHCAVDDCNVEPILGVQSPAFCSHRITCEFFGGEIGKLKIKGNLFFLFLSFLARLSLPASACVHCTCSAL